jgi:hypothetical protein
MIFDWPQRQFVQNRSLSKLSRQNEISREYIAQDAMTRLLNCYSA